MVIFLAAWHGASVNLIGAMHFGKLIILFVKRIQDGRGSGSDCCFSTGLRGIDL